MPYRKVDAPSRGRPRDATRESEILTVVIDLLAESGLDGVTFEEVARRAQASKATLYRRWATRQEMVVAAVKAGPASGGRQQPIDTGSLRGDLLALLSRLEATMQAGSNLSLTLLRAGLNDPDLCEHLEDATGPTGARLPEANLRAAVARGELPETADRFGYEEVAAATLLLRSLNGLTTDETYRETLVDAVLIPALRSGVAAGQYGIFSGRPTPATPRPDIEPTRNSG